MEFPYFAFVQMFVEHVNLENNIGNNFQKIKFVQQLLTS
jgi:hypothetical protein